jgi:hypothetical protein
MDIDFQREKLGIETQKALDVEALRHGIAADIAGLKAELDALKQERQIQAQQQAQQLEHEQAERMAAQQQPAAAAPGTEEQVQQ